MTANQGLIEHRRVGGQELFVLEVPPENAQVRTARLFAAAVARHFGMEGDRVEDVKLAVSEACTNAIRAHRAAGLAEPIRILARWNAPALRYEVVDGGRGFDVDAVSLEPSVTPPGGLVEGSLGLSLVRSLFPDVRIAHNPGQGMTVAFAVEAVPEAV